MSDVQVMIIGACGGVMVKLLCHVLLSEFQAILSSISVRVSTVFLITAFRS